MDFQKKGKLRMIKELRLAIINIKRAGMAELGRRIGVLSD